MVEWKKLGEECEIGTGSNNREDACDNGCYPFYVRSQEVLRIDSYSYDEEAILIPGEGGIGDIFHYINGKYGLHQRTYRVHPITDDVKGRYIYYFLFANFKTYINAKSYKSTAASIRKPMLLDFPIPIPSLEEQTRIVGILDTFTSAIDNLKELIAQRRKQYEYYRDQLLDLEGKPGVEMKTIGNIAKYRRGSFPQPYGNKEWYDGEGAMPFVQVADVEENVMRLKKNTKQFISRLAMPKSVFAPIGTIIVTLQGSIGKVAITQYDSYIDRTLGIFESFTIDINKKYFALQLEKIFAIKKEKARGGTIKTITKEEFTNFIIPLPLIEEQQRIVSILDTFEASVQNLEAQLKEREKQYEYYRNKLLTFE